MVLHSISTLALNYSIKAAEHIVIVTILMFSSMRVDNCSFRGFHALEQAVKLGNSGLLFEAAMSRVIVNNGKVEVIAQTKGVESHNLKEVLNLVPFNTATSASLPKISRLVDVTAIARNNSSSFFLKFNNLTVDIYINELEYTQSATIGTTKYKIAETARQAITAFKRQFLFLVSLSSCFALVFIS